MTLTSLLKYHKYALGVLLSFFMTFYGLYLWSINKDWANWAYVGPICFIIFLILTTIFERNRVEGNRVVKNKFGRAVIIVGFCLIAVAIALYILLAVAVVWIFQFI